MVQMAEVQEFPCSLYLPGKERKQPKCSWIRDISPVHQYAEYHAAVKRHEGVASDCRKEASSQGGGARMEGDGLEYTYVFVYVCLFSI